MTMRHNVRLCPFPRGSDGTFDLPADAPPICAVTFGPVDGAVAAVPTVVWVPYVVKVYDDADDEMGG